MTTLSIGGRLTLLKSVLGSMPIYYMSIFKVPKSVLKRLESIRGRFFNGHASNCKKTSWVRWQNVLASKEKGGLGVSSLYALNRGLMFKWVWRFFTQNNSLWTKVIKAIHGDDGKVGKTVKSSFPSIWLDIVHEMRMLKNQDIDILKCMKRKLGDGMHISFWDEAWCGDTVLKDLYPRLYALEGSKGIAVASKLSHTCLDYSFRRSPRSGVEHDQFLALVNQVQSVSLVPCSDRWVWSLESSGEFSVASIRKLIDDKMLPEVSSKTRWVKVIPIKVNVFAWKVRNDYLPTRFNISRRGMEINTIRCPICNMGVESTSHLFFSCQVIKENVRKIARWWEINYMDLFSYEEWVNWFTNIRLSSKIKSVLEGVFYILWWLIWTYRNKKIFGSKNTSTMNIFEEVVSRSFHWCRSRCKVSFSRTDWIKNPHLISL
ncbi:RNA-directed DNA polymerase, eukaryota, reverse transcriptase zinc-binding domain protein [Tanacetum coccineum]